MSRWVLQAEFIVHYIRNLNLNTMEVYMNFSNSHWFGDFLIYLSSLIWTFRCFGSDPKCFETISAHEREVDGEEVYRQLNEKPQIDRNLSFITGIHAFITCSDFRYNSDCACTAHLILSQNQTLAGERYSEHSLNIYIHIGFFLIYLKKMAIFVIF